MPIVGIDLGTTNSAISVWEHGEVKLIKNALGDELTPSVVNVDDAGNILIGKAAKQRLITAPHHTTEQFKRFIGTDKVILLGKRSFSAIELSSMLLKSLKSDAEAYLNETVNRAIVSVPAYFNDIQRQATKMAAELAGLTVEKLINEPTAAALCYGVHESPDDQTYLILDLGGGTFDVTLLEYFDGVMEVHASSGDNFLGGMDFLDVIVSDFLIQHKLTKSQLSADALSSLHQYCEQLKIKLSQEKQASFTLILDGNSYSYSLNEVDFETKCSSILKRIVLPIERVINDSRISQLSEINDVILVGGATRMPIFHKTISKLLGRIPSYRLNPDIVVAKGAGIQAALAADDQALEDVVLTDVSPFSLGVNVRSLESPDRSFFDPIISRNTLLPVSVSRLYVNAADGQEEICFKVYQGESKFLENNLHLGDVLVDIPKSKAGETCVEVRFSYDTNGLLEVDVYIDATKQKRSALFEQSSGKLSDADKASALAKLAELKVHPRTVLQNITLLESLDRIYIQSTDIDKQFVSSLIEKFSSLIESQNVQEIKRFSSYLKDVIEEYDIRGIFQ
ncbi:molecular chaperone HscC [Shewanella sp. HN-41]|uniref:molecular chaperone HscC n=1 Tax=Shewanella sp. HN-41 TaxID=327275 RepID=UPI000212594F|nr:molecular chaperone HscC [Shewanella sp. HN-41]EGM68761.1 chaperone protein DnaK [Shewanella sp. HN-41]